MLVICGTLDQTVQLKNSSQKICRPSVARLSTDSSPTDDQQSGGRQNKTNSGLLKKTDTQTISFSLMIEYELSRKFYHRPTALL